MKHAGPMKMGYAPKMGDISSVICLLFQSNKSLKLQMPTSLSWYESENNFPLE